jgi:hypothetical protein
VTSSKTRAARSSSRSGDLGTGIEIQSVLDIGAKDVGFDRLDGGPAEEVGEEDQPRHGIEFLGGSAEGLTEMCRELGDGHDFEENVPNDPLPALGDDPPPDR